MCIRDRSPIAPPKLSPRVQRMPRSPSSTRVRRKPPDQCWHCGEPSLSVCSQCLKAEYCSTNHQLLDWHARHAVECESLLKGSSPWQPDSGSPLRISSGLEAPEQRSNVMVSEIDDSALRYKVHKGMLLSKLHELDVRGLPWDDVCEQLESLTTEQRPLTAVFTDADGQHEVSHTFMTGPVRIKWAERSGGAQLVELERQLSIPTMQEEGVEFVGASDPDAGTFTESGSIKEKKKMGRCAC
eukprot:TRINITY_DN12412_c0_g1_i2.p1 TRINITY_DN12412_c0_g1~~TRINITY_DN12412_c0_g1_i2.p1  ORF type:complete len:241 (+),score=52.83 TRINITY_DN12412_c0_g1_i2:85-807(+)